MSDLVYALTNFSFGRFDWLDWLLFIPLATFAFVGFVMVFGWVVNFLMR
jgi:hypothetical protein